MLTFGRVLRKRNSGGKPPRMLIAVRKPASQSFGTDLADSPFLLSCLAATRSSGSLAAVSAETPGRVPEAAAIGGFVFRTHRGSEGEAAGIAPAVAVPQVVSLHDRCVEHGCRWLHYGCTDAALIELLENWPTLPPHVTQTIMMLVRSSRR
jgi:hypothetical protein